MSVVNFKDPVYRLMVGQERGSDAMRAFPEKGMASIKGEAVQMLPFGGDEYIPNRSLVWGRRVKKGNEKATEIVAVTDPQYYGEIEFLKYGEQGGYPVVIRFLESSQSLDYDYQITRLGMPKFSSDEGKDFDYFMLPMGENIIDTVNKKLFATFLKVHHMNDDSPSKMETATGSSMRDMRLLDTSGEKAKASDKRFEASKVVRESNTPDKLDVLMKVVNQYNELDFKQGDQHSMYDALKIFAEEKPDALLERVEVRKRYTSDLLAKCKSFDAMDTSKPGSLVIGIGDKKSLVLDNMDKKLVGDKMVEYIIEKFMDPEIFTAVDKIDVISSSFV